MANSEQHDRDGRDKADADSLHSEGSSRTRTEVAGKIVSLRQSYHFDPKIAMYLKRYHDVRISPSGVWRILKRLDMEPAPRLAAVPAPR